MSHLASQTTRPGEPLFVDLAALKQAAETLGLEMIEQSNYRWYGKTVGDYPLPAGQTAETLGKNAKFVLRIPATKVAEMRAATRYFNEPYEIGILEDANNPGCYVPVYDFFMGGYGLDAIVGEPITDGDVVRMLAPKLKQRYDMVADVFAAQEAGDSIEFLTTKDAHVKYPNTFAQPGDEDTFVSLVNTGSRLGVC